MEIISYNADNTVTLRPSEEEAALLASMRPLTPMSIHSPHSRACGIRRHEHGHDCHSNCPTCHGVPNAN